MLGDAWPHGLDNAGDLVARNHREGDLAPLTAHGVDVGVTDPRESDLDENIILIKVTTLKIELRESTVWLSDSVCGDGAH